MQRGKKEEIPGASKEMDGQFQAKFVQILREENEQTDRLTKAASSKHMLIPGKVLSFV